ncbi:MAG TPA: hypothetical protein VE963_10860 [Reyranella sp.]|nr:hypothetical protein [Reyranella sp.]
MPLPELLRLYLYTRRWEREQRADALELAIISGNLSLSGVEPAARQRFIQSVHDRVSALRAPEWTPDPLAEDVLTPTQITFLFAGRRAAAAAGA